MEWVDWFCLWFGRVVAGLGAACAMIAIVFWLCCWWWRRFADTRVFFTVLSEYIRKQKAARGEFRQRDA